MNRPKAKGTAVRQTCGRSFETERPSARRHCSTECKNASRRRRYVPRPKKGLRPLADRLWSRVDIGAPEDCWEWQGFCHPSRGYGQIGRGRRKDGLVETHRAAWEIANREKIPEGMVVRHRCDNPPCCNPSHLQLGTQRDNVDDAVMRGSVAREFTLPQCRLSDDAIKSIRERFDPAAFDYAGPLAGGRKRSNARELASEYRVTENYVRQIVNGAYRKVS